MSIDSPPTVVKEVPNIPIEHGDNLSEEDHDTQDDDFIEQHHNWLASSTALKFLLAGGIAGAGKLGMDHIYAILHTKTL